MLNSMDFPHSPHSIVAINNRRFDSWENQGIVSASVNLTTNRSGEGVVELFDPDFKIIDGLFEKGVTAPTAMFYFGWTKDVGKPFFSGILARTEWNEGVTTLRFHDNSVKMKQEKKTVYHKKKTDLQILRKLAAKNGLELVVKSRLPESQPFASIMQTQKTDWEFALKIAEQSGLLLYVSGNKMYAVEAGTTKLENAVATLNIEKDFTLLRGFGLSYKLPKNPKGRIKNVVVRGRGKNGKAIVATTGKNDDGVIDLIAKTDLPSVSIARAAQRANARVGKQKEYAFEHNLRTLPSFRTRINLRDTVTLAGMGVFYSGNYFVTEISYSHTAGNLALEMTVGRDLGSLNPKNKK